MADLRYQVQVDTRGATQNLQQLQGRLGGLQTAFGGLRSALGALAFGAAIRSAVGFAAAVNDTSTATNVARQSILGLGQALTTNGGQASKATDAVQRFSLTMGQAAEGGKSAQAAFASVGISLSELGTLDESELLARTIEGLGSIEDSGRRAAIQAQIFGKTMQGVNAAGLAGDFRRLASEQERNAEAVRKAGEAQDKLNAATNRFQIAVVASLEPIITAFNKISDEQLATIAESIVKIAVALGSLAAAAKVLSLLGAALVGLKGYAILAAGGLAAMTRTGTILVSQLGYFARAVRSATGVLGVLKEIGVFVFTLLTKRLVFFVRALAQMVPFIAAVSAGFYVLNEAVKAITGTSITEWIGKATRAVGEFFGLVDNAPTLKIEMDPNLEKDLKIQEDAISRRTVVNQLLEDERKKVAEISTAYRKQTSDFAEKFDLQTRLTRMTEEQRLVEETMAEAQKNYLDAITPLLTRIQELKASTNESDREAIPLLQQGIASITAEYNEQLPALRRLINARLEEMSIQKEQARLEELATQAANRRMAVEESVRDIMLDGQRKIRDAYNDLALQGLSGIERALKQIEIEERRVAEAARERVAAQFGDNDPDGLVRAMNEIARASDEIVRRRQAAAAAIYQEQQSFSNGWRRAWAEYADSANNASQLAFNVFRTATKGMEDALVNFVKTGKFEWRSFVADILEQLLRARIQQGIASLGQSLGLGNLFGGPSGSQGGAGRGASPTAPLFVQDVSNAAGIAGGGVIAQQQAAMAQQTQSMFSKMGEIMGTIGTHISSAMGSIGKVISGLVGSLGSIMGSVMKGMGSALSGIGSMIMSMIRAIVGMFGGYFADGGVLPRGQFGIVGERGPEIITGPATVTPMSGIGGGTQVIYNINAVDARSFQQLLAQDPGLIFALTEQGRKSLAGSRR